MGIESHFFISDQKAIPDYDVNKNWDGDRCEYRRITPLEAAGMLSVIRDTQDDRLDLMDEFRLLTPEEAEEWIMSVPDDMVDQLAKASDNLLDQWSEKCSDVTREELNWSTADFKEVLSGLSMLAKRAADSRKKMYLWNSL